MNMWMVRAGKGANFIDDFIEKGVVGIGWRELGEIPNAIPRDELSEKTREAWPNMKKGQVAISVGQIYRFLNEIQIGDKVLTYDSGRRIYHIGEITSEPIYLIKDFPELPRCRRVNWESEIVRDELSSPTRNVLGAISTLFKLSDDAATEVLGVASGQKIEATTSETEEETEKELLESVRDQSKELIKDYINRLDPYELQDLVAGVLRAMGYKTSVSAPGPDRGVDILASPDGFGFEQPRIVVECKHRRGAMGSQEIRSFLGGRHKDDKGLYVSTGGFSKDARYEAERANIPVTLMDLDQLVEAVIEHYDEMDTETRVLLPLVKLYWPA